MLFLGFLLGATSLPAQVMGNYQQQNNNTAINYRANFRGVQRAATFLDASNEVEITINALSNQPASSYVAVFSVFQAGKTVSSTNEQMNDRISGVKTALRSLGVPEADIYIDMVNFLPTYAFASEKKIFSRKTLTEVPTGFQLQKNIHVRYRDPALLDQIVTAAAGQEVYDIIKVDYQVDRPQDIYTELRQMTFAYLDTLTQIYSEQGIGLDSAYVITAENAWVAYPADRYKSYTAFAAQQLTAQERDEAVVDKIDKPTLRFYDPIPANDYDLVINPDLLAPAAQFSYSLKVRFVLPERKIPTQKIYEQQYFMVTPDGKLVPLRLKEGE
ncbi:DUF541 domain-containing protein [Lewinella sp. W8]|nr:DUF541 domain-containing protein [Lewinella sp. W8]